MLSQQYLAVEDKVYERLVTQLVIILLLYLYKLWMPTHIVESGVVESKEVVDVRTGFLMRVEREQCCEVITLGQ